MDVSNSLEVGTIMMGLILLPSAVIEEARHPVGYPP